MTTRPIAQGERLMKAQLLQLVRETVPGTYDANGEKILLTCLQGDFQPTENWSTFRPDGVSEDAWNALSQESRLYTATVRWDYTQGFTLEEMIMGVGTATDPAPSGANENTYCLPAFDARQISTFTLEFGQPNSCERSPYGIVVSCNQNFDRDANMVDGQIVIMCQAPIATDVAMTGTTAQNSKYRFTAVPGTNAALVVATTVPDNGAVNVTVNPYDLAATIKAAFEAVDGITTSAITVALSYVAKVFGFSSGATPADDYTFAGSGPFEPGTSIDDIQTLIQAVGGNYAAATVTGTSTAGAGPTVSIAAGKGSTPAYTDGDLTVAADTIANIFTTPYILDLGSSLLMDSVKFYYKTTGGSNVAFWGSNTGDFSGEEVELDGDGNNLTDESGNLANKTVSFTAASYRYLKFSGGSGSQPGSIFEIKVLNSAAAVVAATLELAVRIPTTATNPNPTTPAVTGTDAAISVTTPYSVSGYIDTEITDPAATAITMAFVSGAGWSVAPITAGASGELVVAKRDPLMPQQWGLRIASTRAGLAAANAINAVKKCTWDLQNLTGAVYFATEGATSYQSHADDPEQRKLSLTLLLGSKSTLVATLDGYKAATPSTPFWLEVRCTPGDGLRSVKRQFLVSVSAAKARTAAGQILGWQYTLTSVLDDEPFNADPIADGGASVYSVLRRIAA